jgi:hypothetical protein
MVDFMSKTSVNSDSAVLFIVDPQSENILGEIFLVGEPVSASEWIGSNGLLQRFEIIDGMDDLRMVWANQEEVLLQTNYGQRKIKIVTYPTEGETQGYLDYTSEIKPYNQTQSVSKPSIQRGLAFIQSLLGT